jgi:hypothetical protein
VAIEVAEGISGSLHETALTDFLRILAWNGRSGVLLLWDGPKQVGLCFEQGRIVRAQATEPLGEAIERALLLGGHANSRQIEQARSAFRLRRGREWRLLRLLAAGGELGDAGLELAQVAAIRETMRRTLPWTSGQLQFKPNVPPIPRHGLTCLNVEEALIDGLREIDEHNRPAAPPRTVVRWAPAPPPGLTAAMIGAVRWQTLNGCNGRRTVEEVAEALGRPLGVVFEQIQWLLDHGAVLPAPPPPAPVEPVADDPALMPMEDRLVLLLSRFETTWPSGRANRGKLVGALAKMVNAVGAAYVEHWREIIRPEARERVWQTLVRRDLEALGAAADLPGGLMLRPVGDALRDGQIVAPRATNELQATTADRDPSATTQGLLRLLERALLLAVGEVERPVAAVDSFESVNVFVTELNHRLAELA